MINNELGLYKRGIDTIWSDPYISNNLLQLHLNKSTDAATRNNKTIKRTIEWIKNNIPKKCSILDLGCGPGIYSIELAKLGFQITGIDINKYSIDYANENNFLSGQTSYIYANYLDYTIKNKYSSVLMIYCDFGALILLEQSILLNNIYNCLENDGFFIFDVFDQYYNKKNIEKLLKSHNFSIEDINSDLITMNEFTTKDVLFVKARKINS